MLNDTPQGLRANTPFGERQFYTFGIWFAAQGLQQVPINSLFNVGGMIASAQRLIAELRPALAGLPFPLTDPFEAWLLEEGSERPVERLWRLYPEIHDRALLNSARIETRIRTVNRT